MIELVFALIVWEWPHRLAIFATIALLSFYGVYLRAIRARRDRGPFPLGSLALCSCLLVGFVSGESHLIYFGDSMAIGLLAGILIGGLIGLRALASRPAAKGGSGGV